MATFETRLATTAPQLSRLLRELRRDELPFVAAKTLTELALAARDRQRRRMRQVFTIRSQFPVRGITMVPAEKRDWPRARSVVGTRDRFIARFEEGGVQRPEGAQSFAVPTRMVARRRTRTGRIPKRLRPREVLRARRGVIARVEEETALLRTGRKTRDFRGRRILFLFHRRIRLKPVLGFERTVQGVARQRWARLFGRNFATVLAPKERRARAAASASRHRGRRRA